jgi:D-alanine-D-alanine ligase
VPLGKFKKIAIIFGGQSVEHEISLISAQNIIKAIDKNQFEILPIGITKGGQFLLFETENYLINPENPKEISLDEMKGHPVVFLPGKPEIFILDRKKSIQIDIVFPILHGVGGEDGTLQGLLTLSNIPFVGADVLGSALGMDKEYTKVLLKSVKIPVAKYFSFKKEKKDQIDFEKITQELGLPIFIKPANTGSSVGINRVNNLEEFSMAVKEAFTYDKKIIIEEAIEGKEIECSVLGNGNPVVSMPGEVIAKNHFYSYEAKYLDENGAQFNVPVNLEPEMINKIQDYSIRAYQALGVESMARVDGFLTDDGTYYINELNTLPGFTSISMYPKLWEASGLSYKDLIQKLIDLAFVRFEKEKNLKKTIN